MKTNPIKSIQCAIYTENNRTYYFHELMKTQGLSSYLKGISRFKICTHNDKQGKPCPFGDSCYYIHLKEIQNYSRLVYKNFVFNCIYKCMKPNTDLIGLYDYLSNHTDSFKSMYNIYFRCFHLYQRQQYFKYLSCSLKLITTGRLFKLLRTTVFILIY